MLYAQNGSTDAKLRHDEHSKIIRVRDKSQPRDFGSQIQIGISPELLFMRGFRGSSAGGDAAWRRRCGSGWPRAPSALAAAARGSVGGELRRDRHAVRRWRGGGAAPGGRRKQARAAVRLGLAKAQLELGGPAMWGAGAGEPRLDTWRQWDGADVSGADGRCPARGGRGFRVRDPEFRGSAPIYR